MKRPAGFGQQYARAFQKSSVADAYAFRPPYPATVFDVLVKEGDPRPPARLGREQPPLICDSS